MSDRDFGNEDGPSFPETDAKEARDFEEYEVRSANEAQKAHDEFMKGYERNPYQLGKLVSAIVRALDKHKTLRLGQLLVAVASRQTGDYDITNFLFNVYDETLIKLLEEF